MTESSVRWWSAMLVAFGLSLAAAVIDERIQGTVHLPFSAAYVVGCLVAVLVVRPPGLLAAMVEPPSVLLLSVLVAQVLAGGRAGRSVALTAGLQVTGQFPVMAATTGATVLLGLVRMWRRRPPRPMVTAA